MANIKSAIKRAKQNEVERARNASARSFFRTTIKKVLKAVQEKNKSLAAEAYTQAQKVIDRAASKGLIHKNKAARHKSRLSAKIKAITA